MARRVLKDTSGPSAKALLSATARFRSGVLVGGCAGSVAALGAWLGHGTHIDWVDTVVDSRLQASLAGHHELLVVLTRLGDTPAVTVMTAILVLACLARRWYRGAVLAAISIPAAAVITEELLKPFVRQVLHGFPSFPSGHATGTFAIAATITVLLASARWAVRLAIAVIAFAVAAAVSVAMIALDAHYFAETVAGAAVGVGTVLAAALGLDLLMLMWRRSPELPPAVGAEDRPEHGGEGVRPRQVDPR